ncbi:MAG: outer membrane protein assembly factor BamE [Methylotenera sp.]|nr:outer membrane protein assembly factor BamE [Methylotenera sp.]
MRYFNFLRTFIILVAMLLTACGTALPSIKPYKLDVQQGNVVTSKMLLQLRPGMTKSQVRFIMGTPLIQDSFHGNRWDYVYQMRESGKIVEQRRVILDFEKELLKTVRGDVVSADNQTKLDESKSQTGTRVVAPNKKAEEKSLLSKLKFWGKNDSENEQNANVTAKTSKVVEEGKKPEASLPVPPTPSVDTPNPVEEVKPIMAVPLALPATVENTTSQPEPKPVVETPIVEASKPLPVTNEQPAQAAVVKDAVVEGEPAMPKTPSYQSPAGMIFDKNLRSYVPEEPSLPTPSDQAPRVGNKTIPAPKDLPAENDPSFFDRMLEKIGF